MKVKCNMTVLNTKTNEVMLKEFGIAELQFSRDTIMSIDGSTTITGVAFIDKITGSYVGSIAFERENETPVQYKVALKRVLTSIIERNKLIKDILYEEPFIGYIESAKVLLMLRSSIEEIIAEHGKDLEYIKYREVSNKKWKKYFLSPEKCPSDSKLEKKMVRDKLCAYLPFCSVLTQDEIDATSMGMAVHYIDNKGLTDEIESHKKGTAFKYNSHFIGADCDEDLLECLHEEIKLAKVPQKVLDNGMQMYSIDGKGLFNNKVYKYMCDIDELLVIKFSTKTNANVVLEFDLASLADNYEYIYALIWRKTRKANLA